MTMASKRSSAASKRIQRSASSAKASTGKSRPRSSRTKSTKSSEKAISSPPKRMATGKSPRNEGAREGCSNTRASRTAKAKDTLQSRLSRTTDEDKIKEEKGGQKGTSSKVTGARVSRMKQESEEPQMEEHPWHRQSHHHRHRSKDGADIQSWSKVPGIAHFCSLFRQPFDLPEFDIGELEESLSVIGTEGDNSHLVLGLVIRLLKSCSRTFTHINEDNYNTYLRRLFITKREEAEEDGLEFSFECRAFVDEDVDFPDLSLHNRVRVLHQLCEFRLEAEDVYDKLKNLEASSLRVEPLGRDSGGTTYWYFYGTRLYKEAPPTRKCERKEEKDKKKKKKKGTKQQGASSTTSLSCNEEDAPTGEGCWSVACLTLKDWEDLMEKYAKSKKKYDRELHETLAEGFLPGIVKMFAEKEREERRRLLLLQPKRSSNRLERKKQEQEEKDRLLALKEEKERRLEEDHNERVRLERLKKEEEEKERSREDRRVQREQIKELREKRAAERAVQNAFWNEVAAQQRRKAAETDLAGEQPSEAKRRHYDTSDREEKDEDVDDADADAPASFSSGESSWGADKQRKASRKSGGEEHGGGGGPVTNVLLKAGTKSAMDSTLDRPLVRKVAGRSHLQKSPAGTSNLLSSGGGGSSWFVGGLGSPGRGGGGGGAGTGTTKHSLGLYRENLPLDHSCYTKPVVGSARGSDSDGGDSLGSTSVSTGANRANGAVGLASPDGLANWSGEFFKKNLDHRATTDKVSENLGGGRANNNSSRDGNTSSGAGPVQGGRPTPPSLPPNLIPGERFRAGGAAFW